MGRKMRTLVAVSAGFLALVAGFASLAQESEVVFSWLPGMGANSSDFKSICISEVCLGQEIDSLENRLDEIQVQKNKSRPEIQAERMAACKKASDMAIASHKKTLQELSRFSGGEKLKNHSRSAISILSSSEYCKSVVSEEVSDYLAGVSTAAGFPEMISIWDSPSHTEYASAALPKHPELRFQYKEEKYGQEAGITLIEAKTQLGSYADVRALAGTCQPIIIRGRVDGGKTIFMAVNDPATKKFFVVYVATFYQNVAEQVQSNILAKYKEKFGAPIYNEEYHSDGYLFYHPGSNAAESNAGISRPLIVLAKLPGFRLWFKAFSSENSPQGTVEVTWEHPADLLQEYTEYPLCKEIANRISVSEIR